MSRIAVWSIFLAVLLLTTSLVAVAPTDSNTNESGIAVNDEPVDGDALGDEMVSIHGDFTDDEGQMRQELTDDGVHLSPAGYRLWESLIAEHVPEG